MLNPDELAILKADIKAELIKEITGQDVRVAQRADRPLAGVYQQYKKQLHEKFGVYKWAKTWDAIRLLTTFKFGHRYVRDLMPSEEVQAAKFAEALLIMMGLDKEDGEAE